MEGGSRFIELFTYGIIAFVLLAMIAFLARTLMLTLGFLSLPLSDVLQRWRLTRRWLERHLAKRDGGARRPPDLSSR
jgi:hypothetical protein